MIENWKKISVADVWFIWCMMMMMMQGAWELSSMAVATPAEIAVTADRGFLKEILELHKRWA